MSEASTSPADLRIHLRASVPRDPLAETGGAGGCTMLRPVSGRVENHTARLAAVQRGTALDEALLLQGQHIEAVAARALFGQRRQCDIRLPLPDAVVEPAG